MLFNQRKTFMHEDDVEIIALKDTAVLNDFAIMKELCGQVVKKQ